ncbi:hypothetical protein [Deinococcus sp. QL22]|uniref:hypothetical protein n=1 Tax=Deinococcus sp. QL22 TaxID=2939437 RepID=UPI002016F199|nr:hypothetical protein [Deinococcus sp. QL22]UQN09279.1 hypothetical protein M1R55_22150 [Deinococcus sp. QL22]
MIQLDILDKIIDPGRKQLVVTQALRQVVASTLDQQRAIPLAQVGTPSPKSTRPSAERLFFLDDCSLKRPITCALRFNRP